MKEFKGTKGKWEVIENSWSDTTLVCGEKEIATKSIYHEATEETQEELENEVTANFKLIASAPELLEALQNTLSTLKSMIGTTHGDWIEVQEAERVINKALGTSAGAEKHLK